MENVNNSEELKGEASAPRAIRPAARSARLAAPEGETAYTQMQATEETPAPNPGMTGVIDTMPEPAKVGPPPPQLMGTEPVLVEEDSDGEELVTIIVDKGDQWAEETLPKSKAAVILASQMRMPWERRGGAVMFDTTQLNPSFSYYWTSKDSSTTASVNASQLGYKLCKDIKAARSAGMTVENVPGRGECITLGDAVLVCVPRYIAETRQQVMLAEEKKQRYDPRAAVESVISSYGINPRHVYIDGQGINEYDTEVISAENNVETPEYQQSLAMERVLGSANSLLEAQELMRKNEKEASTLQFGGFQGKPGFNNAIPESPYFRNQNESQNPMKAVFDKSNFTR